jgi:hypothetical protein
MIPFVERIFRKRRLSVCRKRVGIIILVSVDAVTIPSVVEGDIVRIAVRSVTVEDFGRDEFACANAPLPSLENISSQIED